MGNVKIIVLDTFASTIRSDGDEEEKERVEKYDSAEILDMLKELDELRVRYNALDKKERKTSPDADYIAFLRGMIADKLGLYTQGTIDYLTDSLNATNKKLFDVDAQLKDFNERMKRHNHEVGGVWTSKAIW